MAGISVKLRIGELKAFTKAVVTVKKVLPQVVKEMGEEGMMLVAESFAKESGPYGAKWAPKKIGGGRILVRTGRLRASFRLSTRRTRFIIRTGVSYAKFHQSGTSRMPRRAMLPFEARLGGIWRPRLEFAAERVLRAHFR